MLSLVERGLLDPSGKEFAWNLKKDFAKGVGIMDLKDWNEIFGPGGAGIVNFSELIEWVFGSGMRSDMGKDDLNKLREEFGPNIRIIYPQMNTGRGFDPSDMGENFGMGPGDGRDRSSGLEDDPMFAFGKEPPPSGVEKALAQIENEVTNGLLAQLINERKAATMLPQVLELLEKQQAQVDFLEREKNELKDKNARLHREMLGYSVASRQYEAQSKALNAQLDKANAIRKQQTRTIKGLNKALTRGKRKK